MKFCKDCRHWKTYPKGDYADAAAWLCWHGLDVEVGYCERAEGDHAKGSNPPLAATCLTEGIYGELATRSDFGCILFEPKASIHPEQSA